MKILNEDILACPNCKTKLELLKCRSCGFEGTVADGMVYLHKNDESWVKCQKEKEGWLKVYKQGGLYMENDDHFFLPDGRPHLKSFYKNVMIHLSKFFSREEVCGKTILDLGAGIGWVANLLSKRHAQVVALECNDDLLVGLGRANKLMEHDGTCFDLVVGDMEDIPLIDRAVDMVLMVDALHHFEDLDKIFKEAHRVLKADGRFYAINEAYRLASEENLSEMDCLKTFNLAEADAGIRERRPTKDEYVRSGAAMNLKVLNDSEPIEGPGLFLVGEKKAQGMPR
ncbi:MAG: class I SAM-dependent methyltransferase [Verrucomicrobia bacterium]|nr:class I SAM-dependent methyltransferase [Verrucomicrobiota bacterium]